MPKWTFNQSEAKARLQSFFTDKKESLYAFGSTVNQTFEAFVLASVVEWYKDRGWRVKAINPTRHSNSLKLKFSTRGAPNNFTYFRVVKDDHKIEIRHALRVATRSHEEGTGFFSNVVLDVAVIRPTHQIRYYKTYNAVPNYCLYTFGEAKHMSAYAELIAGFIGMVHELQPERLQPKVKEGKHHSEHLSPFLFVSGTLNPTAKGMKFTIEKRLFDLNIYSSAAELTLSMNSEAKI